ncbi:MAG: hypothetical protein ACREDF_03730, partial [Thermoplasmata archaeon]
MLMTAALGNGLGFVFWFAVAKAYSPADVGRAATLYGVVLFLAGVGSLGLPYGIIRFLPSEGNKASLVRGAFLASGIASAILSVLVLAGLEVWSPALAFVRSDPALALACVFSIIGFALGAVLDGAFVAARRAGFGTVRTALFGLLRLPIPLLLASSFGILGVILAWTIALVVSVVVGVLLMLPRIAPGDGAALSLEAIRGKGIFGYSLWNHGAALIAAVPLLLLPLMILNAPEPMG